MASDKECKLVAELLGRTDLSITVVAFAIDEAAEFILRYTNRAVLPSELWRIKIRMATDILKYRDLDGDIGNVRSIEMDDVKISGDGAPNGRLPRFLSDYEKQLEMWRLMPRWRRPCFEPLRRREF